MINHETVEMCGRTLEKELRNADEALATAKPSDKPRLRKQRNAINAACNALWRYSKA